MRVGIATDHGGFILKEELLVQLRAAGHDIVDFGAHELNPLDDYPDIIVPLALAAAAGKVPRGIAICGSGVGIFPRAESSRIREPVQIFCACGLSRPTGQRGRHAHSGRAYRASLDRKIAALTKDLLRSGVAREQSVVFEHPVVGGIGDIQITCGVKRHRRRLAQRASADNG